MKKVIIIIVLILSISILTGCEANNEEKIISNGKAINTNKMGHKHCTRNGELDGGEAELTYDLYYTGEVLNLLKSAEKIISASSDVLTLYEDAYRKIDKKYETLEYYDSEVVRKDTTVTRTVTINYDKININALIAIEGEEDNIFENGVPKVAKWEELGKKIGATCKDVEEEA